MNSRTKENMMSAFFLSIILYLVVVFIIYFSLTWQIGKGIAAFSFLFAPLFFVPIILKKSFGENYTFEQIKRSFIILLSILIILIFGCLISGTFELFSLLIMNLIFIIGAIWVRI